MRGYMQIWTVKETPTVGNSKGAKLLTVAEAEKASELHRPVCPMNKEDSNDGSVNACTKRVLVAQI